MVNPNENIRKGYIDAFSSIGVPVWAKKVPKDIIPIPKLYVLIGSQTKAATARDKDSFDWECTIVFDIVSILEAGYSKPKLLDDVEQKMITIIEGEVQFQGFKNLETLIVDSRDLDSETPSQSIERRILTYQSWLNNID